MKFFFIIDREVNIAATLILENFAVPTNHSGASTPSRYSSSDNILSLDNSASSVAEKTKMYEINNMSSQQQNNNTSPTKATNSFNGHKSPKPSSNTQKSSENIKRQKENNGNIHNVSTESDDKNDSDNLRQRYLGNRSWSEIMEAESDDFK